MLKKAYIEITNRCNLRCAFCPGTKRGARTMSAQEFSLVLDKLTGAVEYIYLHVMGEPLSHPQLRELLEIAKEKKMHVCITTNGTLLKKQSETLLAAEALYKVSVSLHSFEGNGLESAQYLEDIWHFADAASKRGVIVALRLWNEGGAEEQNGDIRAFLLEKSGLSELPEERNGSVKLREKLYLERAQKFDWPDMAAAERNTQFCYALRDQVAVLADGTVVPCCLDHEGDIALGNLFKQELSDILDGERARALKEGFSRRCPSEELCRRCGYATRFTK